MSDPRNDWLKNTLGFDFEAAAKKALDSAAANRSDPRFVPLVKGCRKLDDRLDLVRYRLGEQIKYNKSQRAVSGISKAAGTVGRAVSSAAHSIGHAVSDSVDEKEFHAVTAPDDDIFDAAGHQAGTFQAAVDSGDLKAAGEALKAYAAAIEKARARVEDFIEGCGSGAEGAVTTLKVTVAAGTVAAGVATGGATTTIGILSSAGAMGAYGMAQDAAGQVSERANGIRGEIDLGEIAVRGVKDAAISFVGPIVSGALSKQFAKMFGSYLSSKLITDEELVAIGKITNKGVPLARDFFFTKGQKLITEFLGSAGTKPLTKAIEVVSERIHGKKELPTPEEFCHMVFEEVVKDDLPQMFLDAVLHEK